MAKEMNTVVKMTINSKDYEQGLRNCKASMNDFASQIGNAVKSVGKIAVAIRAASGALETFKKILGGTEQGADEFNKIMYTSDTVIKKFYQTLNAGGSSFSFFIENLENIRKNAKEAYEALDNLGTMKMWTSARISQYSAQIAEDRIIVNNKNSSDEEVKQAQERINRNLAMIESLSGDLVEQTRLAAKTHLRNMSGAGEEISDATLEQWVEWFEQGTLEGTAEAYRRMHADYVKGTATQYSPTTGAAAYTYETGSWVFRNKENEAVFDAMNRLATLKEEDGWNEYYNLMKEEAVLREAIANKINKTNKLIEDDGDGGSGKGPTGASMTEQQVAQFIARSAQWEALNADRERDSVLIDIELEDEDIVEPELDALLEKVKMLQEQWEQNIITMNQYSSALGSMASAFSSLASIAADGSPWQKFATMLGSVSSQISSLISTYSSLVAVESVAESIRSGEGIPFPYNLAAMAAAAAAIAGIIASAKSTFAGSYAYGGIVPGTSYSGDKLFARVNSGEMILNRQQQAALFNGGGQVKFVIEGSQLKGVLDNYETIENI